MRTRLRKRRARVAVEGVAALFIAREVAVRRVVVRAVRQRTVEEQMEATRQPRGGDHDSAGFAGRFRDEPIAVRTSVPELRRVDGLDFDGGMGLGDKAFGTGYKFGRMAHAVGKRGTPVGVVDGGVARLGLSDLLDVEEHVVTRCHDVRTLKHGPAHELSLVARKRHCEPVPLGVLLQSRGVTKRIVTRIDQVAAVLQRAQATRTAPASRSQCGTKRKLYSQAAFLLYHSFSAERSKAKQQESTSNLASNFAMSG